MLFEENEKQKKKRRGMPLIIPRDYSSIGSDFNGTLRAREITDRWL